MPAPTSKAAAVHDVAPNDSSICALAGHPWLRATSTRQIEIMAGHRLLLLLLQDKRACSCSCSKSSFAAPLVTTTSGPPPPLIMLLQHCASDATVTQRL